MTKSMRVVVITTITNHPEVCASSYRIESFSIRAYLDIFFIRGVIRFPAEVTHTCNKRALHQPSGVVVASFVPVGSLVDQSVSITK
jgi:hypothetical protein